MRRLPVLAISAIVLAATPFFSFAQQASQSQSQSQAQTQTQPPPAASTANPAAPAKAPASAPAAKPAKVWTNDDLDALRSRDALSTVGSSAPAKNSPAPQNEKSQSQRADWYRKQLAPRYKQLSLLDAEIAKVKSFISGENVGGQPIQPGRMYSSHMTPAEQLAFFENQRQQTQNAIDELLDGARREGIPPGMLR